MGTPDSRANKALVNPNGKLGVFVASFVMDGVLHFILEDADWLGEFEQELDEPEESFRQLPRMSQASCDAFLPLCFYS